MSLEKAISTAIAYETRVRDIYEQAAQQGQDQDEVGRRIFSALAREEQHHLDYLHARLEEWQRTGQITAKKLTTAVPSREKIAKELSKLQKKISSRSRDEELDMLRKALVLEQETSAFYKKTVQELHDEGRKMFARFLEIEDGHVAIVKAELDAVSGMGFWCDFQEFSLEVEGP